MTDVEWLDTSKDPGRLHRRVADKGTYGVKNKRLYRINAGTKVEVFQYQAGASQLEHTVKVDHITKKQNEFSRPLFEDQRTYSFRICHWVMRVRKEDVEVLTDETGGN